VRGVPVLRTTEGLDAGWLAGVLDGPVGAVEWEAIGTGQVGRTVRVRYGGGRSVVVKLASADATSRAAAVVVGAYAREVAFYRDFGGAAAAVGAVPACHGWAIDGDEWFTLVLDDLGAARVGDQFAGCTIAEVGAVLRALAAVQAPTLGAPAPDWLAEPRSVQGIYEAVLPAFLERYGAGMAAEHAELCRWFGPRIDLWAGQRRGAVGLVHGDLRADNLLFDGPAQAPACAIVDWQTTGWGPPLRDVAYLLGGSLGPAERAEHEQALLREYVGALGGGVQWADAWWAYRHESLYGVLMAVVASMLVGATQRGDEMFAAMLARHAAHALELSAMELVPDPPAGAAAALVPDAADEGWHSPGPEPLWNESYYLDCADPGIGVYVRLGRLPNLGRTHAVVAVARPGEPSVVMLDPVAPTAAGDGVRQEVAAASFTVELGCVAALRTFRVSARGTGVAHDDAARHLRGEDGTRADVELDLTWRTDGVPYRWRLTTRYEIPCRVTGHVTVDGRRYAVDAVGQRDHSWGNRDWWQFDWCWSALHLDDGSRWHAVAIAALPGGGVGYAQRGEQVTELTAVDAKAEVAPGGLFGPTTLRLEPGGHVLVATPVAYGPIPLDADDGRRSLFPRALCTVTTADGRTGTGWVEWNLVQR
jgi:Phosphotransferase enzyme family